ncbi:fimbrial protein [Pseudomonas edaphica]|uniref:fimbrial protein n=1 Tax=Pseudomonas edaphica TaxID=2006980 RepID=UPI003D0D226D
MKSAFNQCASMKHPVLSFFAWLELQKSQILSLFITGYRTHRDPPMRKLLSLLTFFSCNALATTCTHSNNQIPTSELSVGAKDAALPSIISSTWHETEDGLSTCINYPSGTQFFSLANNVATATTQSLMFEGASYKIYMTGVKGIGVIMSAADTNLSYKPFISSEVIMWNSDTTRTAPVALSKYRIRFVATEHLPAGPINVPSFQLMRHGIYLGAYYGWGKITAQSTNIDVKYPACQLEMPSLIKLPMLLTRDVQTVGATAGDTPFNIDLNCEAGVTDVNVKYTLTDISSPSNTTSELQLNVGASTATGLAMQVLENDALVSFGPDSSLIGTVNQRDFGKLTSSAGRLSKSFTVRYLRTTAPLAPGKINAGMTITMSYQ